MIAGGIVDVDLEDAPQRSRFLVTGVVELLSAANHLNTLIENMLYGDGRTVATCCTFPRKFTEQV
jgi:hypothetical protein